MATASPQAINRVAIIHNAQFLSQEAQNSLLKILEEPPARTLLVLSVDSVDNLLPTVASRTQKVSLAPPSLGDSLKHFRGRSAAAIESAWLLARGGAGLMSAILADEQNHQLKIAVAEAKRFLAAKPYQRLILLKQFEKDKTGLATFLDGLARTLSALNSQTVKQNRPASAKKVLASRQIVETAIRQLANNANSRLILLTLALDIPL